MTKLINRLQLSKSVIDIKRIDDEILAIDSQKKIYFFDNKTFILKSTTELCDVQNPENSYPYMKNCVLSIKRTVVNPLDDGNIEIMTLESKQKLLFHRPWKSPIEVAVFSDDGTILIAADRYGYIALYCTLSGQVLLELPHNRDYVSAAAISSSNDLFCFCSYDKHIEIINIQTHQTIASFVLDEIMEVCRFIDSKHITTLTREGSVASIDIHENTIKITKSVLTKWPTTIISMDNFDLTMAGSRENELYIIDVLTHEISHTLNMGKEGISSLMLNENVLYIGHKNGQIDIFDYGYKYDELESACKIKDFVSIGKLVKENIFLQSSKIYIETLSGGWEENRPLIIKLFGLDKKVEAEQLAKPFLDNKKYRDEFNQLLLQHKIIRQLFVFVSQKRFDYFFKIVDKDSSLETLPIVQTVRINWNKLYKEAMQRILKNESKIEVEKILRPYYTHAPYAKMAQDLFKSHSLIKEANEFVKLRDFKSFFTIADSHDFLRENEVYTRVVELGKLIYTRVTALEKDEKLVDALSGFKQLSDFTPFKEDSHGAIKRIETKLEVIHLLENNKLIEASVMVNKFSYLNALQSVQKTLYLPFETYTSTLQLLIIQGDIKEILAGLSYYLLMPLFEKKIETILKFAYLEQMKVACSEKKNIDWKSTTDRFISFFGKDLHLNQLSNCIEIELNKDVEAHTRTGEWPDSILS